MSLPQKTIPSRFAMIHSTARDKKALEGVHYFKFGAHTGACVTDPPLSKNDLCDFLKTFKPLTDRIQ